MQPDHSTSGAFLVQDVVSTADDLEEMSIASPVDREHKGPANSLYPRSPWWQTHSPTESTIPTRTHDAGFPSDTSYFPEWMALRVLGLVQSRSNILIYLSLLIVLSFADDVRVLASVSGPIEVRLVAENSTKATFEVFVRPLASIPGTDAKALGVTVKSLLTPSLLLTRHPRTLIQLVIQPLSPPLVGSPKVMPSLHPGIAAASINASSLALMNASVTMKGVVCAAAVARTSSEELILNPSTDQLASSTASGCFAFIFTAAESPDDQLHVSEVWSNWQSSLGFDVTEMFGARELAQQGARHIWGLMKESVKSVGVNGSDDVEVKAVVTDRPPEDGGDGDKMEV